MRTTEPGWEIDRPVGLAVNPCNDSNVCFFADFLAAIVPEMCRFGGAESHKLPFLYQRKEGRM